MTRGIKSETATRKVTISVNVEDYETVLRAFGDMGPSAIFNAFLRKTARKIEANLATRMNLSSLPEITTDIEGD